jgi:hypothetical protein
MKKLSFAVFTSILLFIGCAEKPTNVGGGLIDPGDLMKFDTVTFRATSAFAYKKTLTNGYAASDLVGKISADQEAISFFRFTQYSLLDSLTGATIDTVQLRLYVNYRWNPTLPMQFEVREVVDHSWAEATFNSDSLQPSYIGTKVLGETAPLDSMNFGQYVFASITDTASIRKWANAYYDTISPEFYGLVLQAKSSSSTGVIGFTTFGATVPPALIIKYTRNGHRDSVTFIYGEDTYIAKTAHVPGFGVQGGFGVRSKVTFDLRALDTLQKKDKPTIFAATMELTLRSDSSNIYGYSPDSLIAILGASSTVQDSIIGSYASYGVRTTDSAQTVNPVYRFEVTRVIQQLVNNTYQNEGIQLRWAAEGSTIEKAVFFGVNDPDVSKHPKLKITYGRKEL